MSFFPSASLNNLLNNRQYDKLKDLGFYEIVSYFTDVRSNEKN